MSQKTLCRKVSGKLIPSNPVTHHSRNESLTFDLRLCEQGIGTCCLPCPTVATQPAHFLTAFSNDRFLVFSGIDTEGPWPSSIASVAQSNHKTQQCRTYSGNRRLCEASKAVRLLGRPSQADNRAGLRYFANYQSEPLEPTLYLNKPSSTGRRSRGWWRL